MVDGGIWWWDPGVSNTLKTRENGYTEDSTRSNMFPIAFSTPLSDSKLFRLTNSHNTMALLHVFVVLIEEVCSISNSGKLKSPKDGLVPGNF